MSFEYHCFNKLNKTHSMFKNDKYFITNDYFLRQTLAALIKGVKEERLSAFNKNG